MLTLILVFTTPVVLIVELSPDLVQQLSKPCIWSCTDSMSVIHVEQPYSVRRGNFRR